MFGRKKQDTNPEIFLNLQPDLSDGHALLVVDKETGIKEKIQTNRYVIPAFPRDVDENSDNSEEKMKQRFYIPCAKNYTLRLNIGEHRKFIIGLPKREEDLPLGLQYGEGKEFFTLWIKMIQKKETIENLYRKDIRNKDQLLQEITSAEFYNDMLKHMQDIFKFYTREIIGQREIPAPKYEQKE